MLLSGHRSQLVVRRHGDDVAVFHRPGGEVRVGADDDPGVQFNEFLCFLAWVLARRVLGCSRIGKDVCFRCGVRPG